MAFAPGGEASYAPGHVLVERGARAQAWCRACAEARGWLAAASAGKATAACRTPPAPRKTGKASVPRRKRNARSKTA
jgi:hypothetical protein